MEFKNSIEELDTNEIINSKYINWDYFKNATILVTGATGLIGSQIVKAFLLANEKLGTNIKVVALVRNKKKAKEVLLNSKVKLLVQDILQPIKYFGQVDFIIHTANGTASKSFVEKPVETIDTIIQGTKNVLEFAKTKAVKGIVYLSSMEVYGNIPTDRVDLLQETDLGYMDITKSRNSYPQSKRLTETLCYSYYAEYSLPVKIARLSQIIGAGVSKNDNRVFVQFAKNVIDNKNIVLHTQGTTIRSYCYITDAIAGIMSILENGKNGEVYNIANTETTCSIRDIAEKLSNKYPNSKLEIQLNENCYPETTKYALDTTKIKSDTEWQATVDLEEMFNRLINGITQSNASNKNKHLIENMFSIKNSNSNKVVTILGFRFVIDMSNEFNKFKNLPIKKNKIVFSSSKGKRGYNCNPKYIAEEILKQKLPYELVWLVNKNDKEIDYSEFPKNIRLVDYRSKNALKELATAKVWVDNQAKLYHTERGLTKKKGQIYIQTWHGAMGIKKIGENSTVDASNTKVYDAHKEATLIDYLTSNSLFETNIFKMRFWNNGKILEIGHPRNDIFFTENPKIKQKVFQYLGLKDDCKIILYAPTFRNKSDVNPYDMDYLRIVDEIEKLYNCKAVMLTRLHHEMKNLDIPKSDKIIDVTKYGDIQELMYAADFMISDYSSCIFDFMLSKKPCFIYARDIKHYSETQGFYYPLETTPFPIARSNDEFISNLHKFDYESYKTAVNKFLKENKCCENGTATKEVVELIKRFI